jgi:hypothetical protein
VRQAGRCYSSNGNIESRGGGNLTLVDASVGGNVQITGSGAFAIGPGTTIGNNLIIQDIPSNSALNRICGTIVNGNLQFHNNAAAVDIGATGCAGNSIGGNLQIQNNSAAINVFGNVIGKSLQCDGNTPAPAGSNNLAKTKKGQCSSF